MEVGGVEFIFENTLLTILVAPLAYDERCDADGDGDGGECMVDTSSLVFFTKLYSRPLTPLWVRKMKERLCHASSTRTGGYYGAMRESNVAPLVRDE